MADTQGGGNMIMVPIRWEQAQIDRADALAERTGLTRSHIIRAAFDKGIGQLEAGVAAVLAPAGQ